MSIRKGTTIIAGNGGGLPDQTGQAGKFLTTDGTEASWEEVQAGSNWVGTLAEYNSGTVDVDGYGAVGAKVFAILPSLTPTVGMPIYVSELKPTEEEMVFTGGKVTRLTKVLSTIIAVYVDYCGDEYMVAPPTSDKITATVPCDLSVEHPSWTFYITDTREIRQGNIIVANKTAKQDDNSITVHNNKLQTVGVINQNNITTAIKTWTGTKAEYDALGPTDAWYAWDGQSWYAWTIDETVYYTKSSTPAVGDIVYNANKEDSGKTISAVGSGYIEFSDTRKLSFIFTGRTDLGNYGISVNGVDYNMDSEVSIRPGDNVVISDSTITDKEEDTSNSSDTNYIPNGYIIGGDTIEFIMPDKDLYFEVYVTKYPY